MRRGLNEHSPPAAFGRISVFAGVPCATSKMDVLISFTKVSEDRELESLVIALEDRLGLYDLSPEEVRAIGEHEHGPDIIAAALGTELLHSEYGPKKIRDILVGRCVWLSDAATSQVRATSLARSGISCATTPKLTSSRGQYSSIFLVV